MHLYFINVINADFCGIYVIYFCKNIGYMLI